MNKLTLANLASTWASSNSSCAIDGNFRTNTLGKGMIQFILPIMSQIVTLLFFYEGGFSFK